LTGKEKASTQFLTFFFLSLYVSLSPYLSLSLSAIGLNLHELADLLISQGAMEAVNLDGGGSVSLVIDGIVVNAPSDLCDV
jgi:hypothetical protein